MHTKWENYRPCVLGSFGLYQTSQHFVIPLYEELRIRLHKISLLELRSSSYIEEVEPSSNIMHVGRTVTAVSVVKWASYFPPSLSSAVTRPLKAQMTISKRMASHSQGYQGVSETKESVA